MKEYKIDIHSDNILVIVHNGTFSVFHFDDKTMDFVEKLLNVVEKAFPAQTDENLMPKE